MRRLLGMRARVIAFHPIAPDVRLSSLFSVTDSVLVFLPLEAFRTIDIPEGKALKAATTLGKCDDDVSSLKGEPLVIEWMMGFVLAFQVACLCIELRFRDAESLYRCLFQKKFERWPTKDSASPKLRDSSVFDISTYTMS